LTLAAGGWLLLGSEYFAIKQIIIEGGERVQRAREDLRRLIGIRAGENIFMADLERARAALLRLPWVREVQLRRRLPSRIEILIEERRPFVLVSLADADTDEKLFWVDREGYLLEEAHPRSEADSADRLLIEGAQVVQTGRGPRLRGPGLEAVRALSGLDEAFLERFATLQLTEQGLILTAREGFKVFLDPDLEGSALTRELQLLERLLTVIDGRHYLYIDLRFGDLVLRPR